MLVMPMDRRTEHPQRLGMRQRDAREHRRHRCVVLAKKCKEKMFGPDIGIAPIRGLPLGARNQRALASTAFKADNLRTGMASRADRLFKLGSQLVKVDTNVPEQTHRMILALAENAEERIRGGEIVRTVRCGQSPRE